MKRKIITLILVSCVCLPLVAQHRHEFSINVGGGLSTLDFKPTSGKYTAGFGGEAGLGYHFFFSPNWGIGTGVNLGLYNSEATLDNYSRTIGAVSPKGHNFDFSYTYTDYKEELSAMMVTIPLMLQFQTTGKIAFFAAAGGKVGIPVNAKYTTSGNLYTNGYFPDYQVTYDDLEQYGLGSYEGMSEKADMNLKVAFMLSGELGAKWRLSNSMYLYTGAYIDYGLNNIKKDEPQSLLAYNNQATSYPAGFEYNSMANSMSDKIAPLAIGAKIRLSFGCTPFAKVEKEVEPVAPAPVVTPTPAPEPKPAPVVTPTPAPEPKPAPVVEPAPEPKPAPAPVVDNSADIAKLQKPIDYYDLSQETPEKLQQNMLDEKIAILKQHPDWTIKITGHTCDLGGNAVNAKVGMKRAQDAKNYMVSKGIDAKRIVKLDNVRDTVWVGDKNDKSDENRKRNRRVTVTCELCK